MPYTFGKLYEMYKTLADKSETPYFPEGQFDEIANIKYGDFVDKECQKIESNQEHTGRIHRLYRPFFKANSSVISVANDLPEFFYLLRFTSKYKKDCNGVVTYPEVNIRKAPNNNVDVMQADPYSRGIDKDPAYVPDVDGAGPIFKVLSDTTPLELKGLYVRAPQKIDSENNPNSVFELDDFVAEALVRAIVFRTDIIIENLQRAAAEGQEVAQKDAE